MFGNKIGRHEFRDMLDAIADRYDEQLEDIEDNVIAFPIIPAHHPSWDLRCDEDGNVIIS